MEIASQMASGKKFNEINWTSVAIEGVSGAATGLLMTIGVPANTVTTGRAVINAATSVAHSIDEEDSPAETIKEAAVSATMTLITGNAKNIGRSQTQGKHLELGEIGTFIKKVTYEAQHIKPKYIVPVISNRFIRGASRIVSQLF